MPDVWNKTEHSGRIHTRDESGTIRIRIDPADNVGTPYPHKHIYDINGNIVPSKSSDAHILLD